jgi:hypothetical protein
LGDPQFRASTAALSLAYSSRLGERVTDHDYLNFKSSPTLFHDSPFPDEVPTANRSFESWIQPLLH